MNPRIAKALLLGVERLRGERLGEYLCEMERVQTASRRRIMDIQRDRLDALLSYAIKNNSYYREKYSGEFDIGEFNSLPLLTKTELRANANKLISSGHHRDVTQCKTSGSTGEPLKFYRDKIVFGRTLASVYRAHRWHDLDIGAREAMLWGIPNGSLARLKMRARDLALNRFREREYNLSPSVLDGFYRELKRSGADYIFGYSSMVYEFALFCGRNGLPTEELGLKAAICTAESIYPHQREKIESVFDCRVVSEYGSAETGIISYECPRGGHHISDDVVKVELIGGDGAEVPIGQVGRVVVTVLFSHAAPIIRYELGDYAVRRDGTCKCGVKLSLLDRIVGRTSGIIVTPDGRCFHSIVLYYLMKDYADRFGGIRQFRVRQTHRNRLEIHLVTDDGFRPEAKEWLADMLSEKFGKSMGLEFFAHEKIERTSSGKLSDFESLLDVETELVKSFDV